MSNATIAAMSPSAGWERFVVEYLKDYDSYRAVRRTFPHITVHGERRRVAARLLREPWILEEIERRSATRLTLADVNIGRITTEMARAAFFDPRKLVRTTFKQNKRGEWKSTEEPIPLSELDDDTALALKEFKRNALGEYDVKAHDKLAALQALAVMTAHANGTATTDARGRPLPSVEHHDAMPEDEVLALLEGYEDNQSTTIDGELDGGDETP